MVYEFALIIDASRQAKRNGKTFVGLDVDIDDTDHVAKSDVSNAALRRSFTPCEIKKLIEDNIDILSAHDRTFRGNQLQNIYNILDDLEARADDSGFERPLTVEEFDDKYQKQECVYGITR